MKYIKGIFIIKYSTYIFIHYCSRVPSLRFRINVDFIMLCIPSGRAHEFKPDVAMSIILCAILHKYIFFLLFIRRIHPQAHTHSDITFPPEVFPPLLTQNNNSHNHNNNKQYIKNKILMRGFYAAAIILYRFTSIKSRVGGLLKYDIHLR